MKWIIGNLRRRKTSASGPVDDEIKRLVGKSIVRTNDFPSLCRKKQSSLNKKLEEHPFHKLEEKQQQIID
jgi:hypothetical protein